MGLGDFVEGAITGAIFAGIIVGAIVSHPRQDKDKVRFRTLDDGRRVMQIEEKLQADHYFIEAASGTGYYKPLPSHLDELSAGYKANVDSTERTIKGLFK